LSDFLQGEIDPMKEKKCLATMKVKGSKAGARCTLAKDHLGPHHCDCGCGMKWWTPDKSPDNKK